MIGEAEIRIAPNSSKLLGVFISARICFYRDQEGQYIAAEYRGTVKFSTHTTIGSTQYMHTAGSKHTQRMAMLVARRIKFSCSEVCWLCLVQSAC